MTSIKEDSSHFNSGTNESSQQDGEETALHLNELFEAKNITAVTSKDQVLRLKIYPGARFEINTSIIQQNGASSTTTGPSTATTSAINSTRKPKSEDNLQNQQNINLQTQGTITDETIPLNGNGTVAFKQIFSQQYSQDSKFLHGNEEGQLAQSSQEKSLIMPSIIGGAAINLQNQQQQQRQQGLNNNSVNQNNMIGQNSSNSNPNPAIMFYSPSDFLIKEKWINLIVDLKSFFREITDDFVVKNIEIGSQCRLKSIFYSKHSDLSTSLIGKHELIVNSGTSKFIPQVINFQQVSQMIDDSSPKHGRKSLSNNINFVLPHTSTAQTNAHLGDINNSHVDASVMIHNSIALPAKTPNKSSRYQSRYSVHLSNYKHSQVALYSSNNGQSGSSKSYSKQAPPPLVQYHQSPSAALVGAGGAQSTSASNTSNYTGSSQLSKIMKRRESKNGYSGNYNSNNHSFQQQPHNNQSLQYNQHSYLSSNVSFEQPSAVIHSHVNTQNVLYYQSTSQSTHPNQALNSDEEGGKCLYSGSNTQRTSSVYFYNAKRSSRSNVSGMQQHPSYHASSQQQYQNSYLNNSITTVGVSTNNGQLNNNNNNSIRLPKIISLLKQRSSSIYSGVTNRSNQIVEELDIQAVQNISNINSTRRNKDSSRLYQVGTIKSPNSHISNNNINQERNQNNGSCPHKSTVNNKISSGLEALLIQNGESINLSPSKNNINSSRTNQKSYKSSQQRFVTMSINQSPKNRNYTQNTLPNFDLLPNNTSIHQPNSNDLYNIADQGALNHEDEMNPEKRIRSEDDVEEINKSIRPENSKLSVMSKLSTALFKNSVGGQGMQNKENDPRSRNTPAQKKEKSLNLNSKRRSSLFSAGSIKHTQVQQNCQTINSINTINTKGSIQTSRHQNSNSQHHQQNQNNQQQYMQYHTQQSSIQNDDDQLNTDYSQYAYYAPKNKKSKVQSQSPSQIVSHRNGSVSVRKGSGQGQSQNKTGQMQIINSPQQQSPLTQQRSQVRNSYSIINKRQSAGQVQQKQNSVQIDQQNSINISADSQINHNDITAIQNEKIERKRKIIMQQQYLQNKDSFSQDNTSQSQPLQKIGASRVNYHNSPPPPIHKHQHTHTRDNSQETAASHVQTKSKISLMPSNNLQHSLQAQIIQMNPSNALNSSINQGYQPSQSMAQASSVKKQLHHQQITGPTTSKSNSRNQSPLVNKFNQNCKQNIQAIANSNSNQNSVNIKIDTKSNSLERTSVMRKSPPHNNNNSSQQQTQSPNIKKNPQKSTFSYDKQQQSQMNNNFERQKQLNNDLQQLSSQKKNKISMGLDFSKLPTNSTQSQDNTNRNTTNFVVKTEELPDNIQSNYNIQKLPARKISEGQEKSPSRGRDKKEFPKKNLLQAFNQAEGRHAQSEENSNPVNIKNEQLVTQQEDFEDEQKIAEQNEVYYKNIHRFSSTFNNPELCLPLTLIQKNPQPSSNNPNRENHKENQSNEQPKTFQIGLLKNPPIALTASNLHSIQDQKYEQVPIKQDKQESKQNTNSSNREKSNKNTQDKTFKRKYQKNQLYKKKSKSSSDGVGVGKNLEEEQLEEQIELQQSECIPTNPNEEEVIEEKIETKSITLTNQSKSMGDLINKNEAMLKTSGSVYESEHMTSSEEECNESGLAISIQVDNIDIKEENELQTIAPLRKKQQPSSAAKKKGNGFTSPKDKERSKRKQESGNKFIQEIEKQIPSSNSIEVSRVVIVQDDDDTNEQLANQVNSLPYTSDWRIQSLLIENKTDILKNRIHLSNLINGVGLSSKTQPVDGNLKNQELFQLFQTQEGGDQVQSPAKELQKQKSLPTEDKQGNQNKKFAAPQILQLNDVISATE